MFERHFIPRGGVAIMVALLGLSTLGIPAAQAQEPVPPPADTVQETPPVGIVVDSVLVRGNQRIDEAAVRAISGLGAGSTIAALDIQNAIRRLMETGNFETVEIYSRGDLDQDATLVLDVVERPLIAEIDFRGLERVSPGTVRDTIGLQANQPLDPNQVARTEQMIRQLLAGAGVQVLGIDTTLTPLNGGEGGYRLTFNVREGQRLSIADVDFRGNEAFSDETLRDAIGTKEEGFLWFRDGQFDPETFQTDLNTRLPAFYGERGYIDFTVASDTLIVDPETGKARLVVDVSEGPQYRLGEFEVEGNNRFPTEQLESIFRSQRRTVLGLPFGMGDSRESGEVFDRVALSDAAQRINQLYRNEGYLFAQVEPVVERIPADSAGGVPRVDVTLAISEQSPFYIDRVRISGNTYTHESVIRDRLFVFPGDVYNEDRLLQSYQSISSLGFFETPLPTPQIDPNPEEGTVDLTFYVEEKQTGSINFGTAVGGGYGGGLSGFLGYSQPNLFGQGKQASLRAEYGFRRNSFQASYTDPALFGTRNSGSVSLFHFSDRFNPLNDGRSVRTGASLQYGFPLPNLRWSRAFVGYSLARTDYQAANQEDCEAGEVSIFCLPTATSSSLSFGLTRDTRNGQLFPTLGTRQALSLEQVGGPLGGNGGFQKVTTDFEWWVPVGDLGGDQPGSRPIRFALGMQARVGTVFGDASRFPFERFFLGGTQFGEPLRGYGESEITPSGFVPDGFGGFPSTRRVGNAFLTLTTEYAVRFNDNLSLSLFADAGNVWNDVNQIDPTRLFRGAGIGVTVVTPFGPLGLDYAYGFDKDEPGWQFHFKLGQGF